MWRIRELTIQDTEYDFSSAGLARGWSQRLLADDVEVANLLSFIDWRADDVQLLVCKSCGSPGCASGGWVTLRRAGEVVLILPSFGRIATGVVEIQEHAPPPYLMDRGIILLDSSAYCSLRAQVSRAPVQSELRALTGAEAARVVQWEAPRGVLGRIPDPVAPKRESFLAFEDDLDLDRGLELLASAIGWIEVASEVRIRPKGLLGRGPVACLDLPGAPTWAPLATGPGGPYLRLGEDWVFEHD